MNLEVLKLKKNMYKYGKNSIDSEFGIGLIHVPFLDQPI